MNDAGLRPLPEYEPPARPPAGELADWEPLADMESIRVEEQQNRVTVITRVGERVIPWRVWCEAEPHIRTDAEGFEASPGLRLMGPSWIQATKDEINKAAERLRGARPVTSLPEFLRARLDEDERTAREAAVWWGDSDEPGEAPHWRPVPCGHIWNDQDGGIADELADRHAAHIARHDPARVLANVESKRRIIEACVEVIGDRDLSGYGEFGVLGDDPDALAVTLAVETLRLLAKPFADHPDYRPEWRL